MAQSASASCEGSRSLRCCSFLQGIRSLGYLPSLSNLRELSVACNSLQDLQGISKLQQLQLLDVSFNQLVTLAGVQQLPQLHTLNAAHNKLTTAESIRGATSLQRLALNNNAIASAAGLLPLSELQGLTALTLSGNPVVKTTPAYAGATARMLPALRVSWGVSDGAGKRSCA